MLTSSSAPPALLGDSLKPFKSEDSLDLRRATSKQWKSNGTALRQPECGPSFCIFERGSAIETGSVPTIKK